MLTPSALEFFGRNKFLAANFVQIRATEGEKVLGYLKTLNIEQISFKSGMSNWRPVGHMWPYCLFYVPAAILSDLKITETE